MQNVDIVEIFKSLVCKARTISKQCRGGYVTFSGTIAYIMVMRWIILVFSIRSLVVQTKQEYF